MDLSPDDTADVLRRVGWVSVVTDVKYSHLLMEETKSGGSFVFMCVVLFPLTQRLWSHTYSLNLSTQNEGRGLPFSCLTSTSPSRSRGTNFSSPSFLK